MSAKPVSKLNSKKILVIEDSKLVISIISNCFKSWKYDFSVVSNGLDAWDAVVKYKPEIILLDWNLPGMDGISICKKIREFEKDRYIYIIMVTSMNKLEYIIEGFNAGADDYLTKPFEKEVLRARIKVGRRIIDLEKNLAGNMRKLQQANISQEDLINKLQNQNRIIKQKTDELKTTQKQLLDTARRAGMAEIATNVLHNVGNVLNTAITSSSLINESLSNSKVASVLKLAEIVGEYKDDFVNFVSNDQRGKNLPEFFMLLSKAISNEHTDMRGKLKSLQDSHEHIREIISLQQSYIGVKDIKEPLSISEIMNDVLQMISIQIDFQNRLEDFIIHGVKHKIIQILINLIQNARDALLKIEIEEPRIKIFIDKESQNQLKISVTDNGIGIKRVEIKKIFNYGFSTTSNGQGIGLHSCANLAKEMGGSLTAFSDGLNSGARFSLILPVH